MSNVITTKSPVFWVIVCAGVVLPALSLEGPALIATTLLVVAFVVIGFVRARRQGRGTAARS